MDKQLKNLISIYFVCGLPLIIVVILRYIYKIDEKKIERKVGELIGIFGSRYIFWKFTHFIMYFFLGYYSPNYWYLSTAIGILWENIEILSNNLNIPIYPDLHGDMVANSLGLLCGIVTRFS